MNNSVINNYSKLKPNLFFFPVLILISLILILYANDYLNINSYSIIQKDCFFFLNSKLSQYPNTLINVTQLGNELISLSMVSLFILIAPRIWESLLSALLISASLSIILKDFFEIPRPAAIFDQNTFVIIGENLSGNNSFPSGHAASVFMLLTVFLFAFMPNKFFKKMIWCLLIILAGACIVLTRVGVGAHYPLDVFVGSIIGYISGVAGILFSQKFKVWNWINNKKFYPIFIALFLICGIGLVNKILTENLFIFYIAFISLMFSLYKIITVYAKK